LGVMRGLRVGRRVDLGLVVFMPQRTDGPLPSSLETQIRRKFGGIPQRSMGCVPELTVAEPPGRDDWTTPCQSPGAAPDSAPSAAQLQGITRAILMDVALLPAAG